MKSNRSILSANDVLGAVKETEFEQMLPALNELLVGVFTLKTNTPMFCLFFSFQFTRLNKLRSERKQKRRREELLRVEAEY